MEFIDNILNTTINSFDFGLVISINVATYIINTIIGEIKQGYINPWVKRIVMLICGICISTFYHFSGDCDDKLILNSFILAPVFWTWLAKPILRHIGYDYRKDDIDYDRDRHKDRETL